MSINSSFVFPPPPPPPPKAAAPDPAHFNLPQSYGQGRGRGSRGGFNVGQRGRGWRASGSGSRGGHSATPPRPASQGQTAFPPAAPFPHAGYGQPQTGTVPLNGVQPSIYGQQTVRYQPSETPSGQMGGANGVQTSQAQQPNASYAQYPALPSFAHTHNSAFVSGYVPLSGASLSFTASTSGDARQNHTHGSAQTPASSEVYQPQMMGPVLRMGFDRSPSPNGFGSSSGNSAMRSQRPYVAPQNRGPHRANMRGSFKGRHVSQFNPRPPKRSLARDDVSKTNVDDGHEPSLDSFAKRRRSGTAEDRVSSVKSEVLSPLLPVKLAPSTNEADSTTKERKRNRRKHNMLGLTPRTVEHEDSEEDVDEEMVLAKANTAGTDQLSFEYNGKISSLNNPAEIAAWIEERRRRFPTKQRIQEKKEEQERRIREAKERRDEALRERERGRAAQAKELAAASKSTSVTTAKQDQDARKAKKMQKVLKRVEMAKTKLAKLEAQIAKSGQHRSKRGEKSSKSQMDIKEEASVETDRINGLVEPSVAVKLEDSETQETFVKQEATDDTSEPIIRGEEQPGSVHNGISVHVPELPVSSAAEGAPKSLQPAHGHTDELTSISASATSTSSLSSSRDSDDDDDTCSDSSSLSFSVSSSSSSGGSSDDEGPIELPTLRHEPDGAPAASSGSALGPAKLSAGTVPICRQFVRNGRCPRQRQRGGCRYRHELPPRVEFAQTAAQENNLVRPASKGAAAAPPHGPANQTLFNGRGNKGKERPKRKGLYQRMLENDQQKEDMLVLDAIRYLGERGLLDEIKAQQGQEAKGEK